MSSRVKIVAADRGADPVKDPVGQLSKQRAPQLGPTMAGAAAFVAVLSYRQYQTPSEGDIDAKGKHIHDSLYLPGNFWEQLLLGGPAMPHLYYALTLIGVLLVAAIVYFLVDLVGGPFAAQNDSRNRERWQRIIDENQRMLRQCENEVKKERQERRDQAKQRTLARTANAQKIREAAGTGDILHTYNRAKDKEETVTEMITDRIKKTTIKVYAKCPICAMDMVDQLSKTKCGHVCHSDCINDWILCKYPCPECNAMV